MSRVYYPQCRVVIKPFIENFGVTPKRSESFEAVPQSISIKRNSYKQADSWSIDLDAKDVPIPPSLVRTAGIEIYLYDNQNFEGKRDLIKSNVAPAIVGMLDDLTLDTSSDGRILSLSGQDYTALFIEHQFKKSKKVGRGQFLDDALRSLIQDVDRAGVLGLQVQTEVVDLPVVGRGSTRALRRGYPVKRGDSYWDVMYKLAVKHGFIIYVKGLEVILTTPQDLKKQSRENRAKQFFLTWGQQIENVTQERHLGKQRVPVIEIVSYDESRRKPVIERFPKGGNKVTTAIGTKRNEVLTIPVYGVTDRTILARLAEANYILISGAEQTLRISTRELVDENSQDLIQIQTGDTLHFRFDPFNSEHVADLEAGQQTQWLIDRGFSPQAAAFYAQSLKLWNIFKQPYTVRSADINWSHSDGLSIGLEISNFVTKTGVQEPGIIPDREVSENV